MFRRCAVSLVLVLAVACGGGGGNNPPPSSPGEKSIDPGVSTQLGGGLTSGAAELAAQAPQEALATQAAALAVQADVKVNDVSLTASLLAGPPDRAALSSGSAQAFGFQLTVLNLPGSSAAQIFSGVLAFRGGGDWVLVAGPSPGAPIPPAIGVLGSGGQVWKATAGNESAQLKAETTNCQWLRAAPAYVTGCKYANFTGAGFSITSSTRISAGASGSKKASLASGDLLGISLVIDCNLGRVCPSATTSNVSVIITDNPPTLTSGDHMTFHAQVSGTSNTAVTWKVEEAGGGEITQDGSYTAPAVATGTHFTVRATSQADTSKYGHVQVTVTPVVAPPVTVTVTESSVTVPSGTSHQFYAEVTNAADTTVTWSVVEAPYGGSINAQSGYYTAPTVTSNAQFTVRATSVADPSKHGDATVNVTAAAAPSVTIAERSASVNTLGSIAFHATVSNLSSTGVYWSIEENPISGTDFPAGMIDSNGNYKASGFPGKYTIKATSQVNSTVSDSVQVQVTVGCMEALKVIKPIGSQTVITMVGRVPVKVDSQGRPVVVWIEYAPFVTYVARYENGAWNLLGSSGLAANGNGGYLWAGLAIDSHDHPVVAYEAFNSTSHQAEIWVASWDGTSNWNVLPAPVPQGNSNSGFALTLKSDQPVVAVARNLNSSPYRDIAVAQWNGSSWVVTGGIYATAGELVSLPDVIVDSAGDITVAWEEQVPPFGGYAVFKPFAKKLSGPGAGLIPSPNTGNDYYEGGPALAFDSSRKLAMAWSNFPDATPYVPSDGLEVTTWNGSSWSQVGTTLEGLTSVVVPEYNGTPYNPHRLILNPDTGMLAASTTSTSNDIAAVFEQTDTGSWSMVCAPMPDSTQNDDVAKPNYLTGLAYDPVGHRFVLAATTGNGDELFVARIKH
ncbi:MAG TPA: hypothetical protein VMT11_07260 [Myxococcaceae bacterium]|nr:hypothetical protein [Myxococcaceae bacterium]